jgi:hydrogenase maturation protease
MNKPKKAFVIRHSTFVIVPLLTIMNEKHVLILGVGNVLMGDEGVGVHAIWRLEQTSFHSCVRLVDGGTGGFHLLPLFDECESIVMIDATMDGQPPGTVSVIEPRFASDFPKALSAHDIGLRDLVESAALLNSLPKTYLVTVSVEKLQPMCLELSEKVRDSLPAVEREVRAILEDKTIETSRTL